MPDHLHWLLQRGFHDRAIRKQDDLVAVARYIVANPLRAGIVDSIRNYPLWDAKWLVPTMLASLERIRVQIVAREQLVKVRAIAFCQASRLTHIAHRDLRNL